MKRKGKLENKADLHVWILAAVDRRLKEASNLLGEPQGTIVEKAVFAYLNQMESVLKQLREGN